MLKSVAKTTALVLGNFFSLIWFPEFLPLLFGVWILLFGWLRKPKFSWPIWLCVAITIIKLPSISVSLVGMVGLMIAIAILSIALEKNEAQYQRRKHVMFMVLSISLLAFGIDYWRATIGAPKKLDPKRPVACLGDSLTDYGYPENLADMLSVPVLDYGMDGIDTEAGLKLSQKIIQEKPQAIIIELGGHDYNKGFSRASTYDNLKQLIEVFLSNKIEVILVEIPRGVVSDPFWGIERQLAREYDLELIPDTMIRRFFYWSPVAPPGIWVDASSRLSTDGLHPSKLGNQLFADYVQAALKRKYGDKISK